MTRIELGLSMISNEILQDIEKYIPTWHIRFKQKWRDQTDDEYGWDIEQMMLSAIDGNYIEPRITNKDLLRITS